jgi:hypothetical protein
VFLLCEIASYDVFMGQFLEVGERFRELLRSNSQELLRVRSKVSRYRPCLWDTATCRNFPARASHARKLNPAGALMRMRPSMGSDKNGSELPAAGIEPAPADIKMLRD